MTILLVKSFKVHFLLCLLIYFPAYFGQVRGMLAQLGYEKLDDIIGRTDLLRPRDLSLMKTQHLDLNYILSVCIYLFSYHV
jgi:hypothetical protein